jgi:TonB family protein
MSLNQNPAPEAAPLETISTGVAVQPRAVPSTGWRIALLSSLVLHAALLGWAVLHFSAAPYGARGVQLEGIAIETISSAALDSLLKAAQPTGGDTAAPSETAAQTSIQPQAQPTPTPAIEAPALPSVITAPSADTSVPAAQPEPKPILDDKLPEAKSQPTTSAAIQPSDTGGATSETTVPSVNSAASAGAAPGDVQRYASDVRRVLSRNRPKANWPAGALRLAFTISDSGDVAKAEVIKPSGNAWLDQRALTWIGATRFPTPPAGLTTAERTYAIPVTVERKAQ